MIEEKTVRKQQTADGCLHFQGSDFDDQIQADSHSASRQTGRSLSRPRHPPHSTRARERPHHWQRKKTPTVPCQRPRRAGPDVPEKQGCVLGFSGISWTDPFPRQPRGNARAGCGQPGPIDASIK